MSIEDSLPDAVRRESHTYSLQKGEVLFSQGSPTVGVYEVLSGRVRLARTNHTGHYALLYVAQAGDPLAEASVFTRAYHCEAAAVTPAVVRLYPKAALLTEFERDASFAKGYALMLAHQLMTARSRVERLSMRFARDRVRHYLVLNTNEDGCFIELPGTLKELARELGLTHEVLYRTLAQMTRDGEIERTGHRIRLLQTK